MPLRALEPKSGKSRRIEYRGLSNQRLSFSPTSVVSPDFTRFGPKFGPKIDFESLAWKTQQRETVEIPSVEVQENRLRLVPVSRTVIAQHSEQLFACAWSKHLSGRANHRVVTATNFAGASRC
jgi:hypothetical protein